MEEVGNVVSGRTRARVPCSVAARVLCFCDMTRGAAWAWKKRARVAIRGSSAEEVEWCWRR